LFLPPLQYFENPPNDEDFQFRDPYDFPILIDIFPKETDLHYIQDALHSSEPPLFRLK